MINLIIFIAIFLVSWLLVGAFRKWSAARSILDVPNARSSHENPTPVGGGIVIVLVTLVSAMVWELSGTGALPRWPFYFGGLLIAVVSWFDDLKHIPAPARLTIHILAAAFVVWQIGFFSEFEIYPGREIELGYFGAALTVLWIVWLTNAYNFMDGIDGLAGGQAVFAAAAWALSGYFFEIEFVTFFAIALIGSSLGFLVHNWPPAKVFMGDVGSAFLGFTFAVLPILALVEIKKTGFDAYLPLLGVAFVCFFVSDTLITFARRIFARERVWSAHRKHLYQELIKSNYSHLFVTLLYLLLIGIVCGAGLFEVLTGFRGLLPLSVVITVIGLIVFVKIVSAGQESEAGQKTE